MSTINFALQCIDTVSTRLGLWKLTELIFHMLLDLYLLYLILRPSTINPAGYPMDSFKLTPSGEHVKCHTEAERAGGGDKSKFLNCVYLFE